MKCSVLNLRCEEVGSVNLSDDIFGLPSRRDILARMVNYQRAKRRSGNHKTKGISEVSGTTKKPWKQKGTGRARAGSLRAPQMRGGATIFGPVVRSHAHSLPKKVRKLALKTALSVKAQGGSLIIIDTLEQCSGKTKEMAVYLEKLKIASALFVGGEQIPDSFSRGMANIPLIDVLSIRGINVYDILRRKTLVLTKEALKTLEDRLL